MNKKKDKSKNIFSNQKKSQNDSFISFNTKSSTKKVDFAIASKIIEYMQIEEKF